MTLPLDMSTFSVSSAPMNYIMIRAYINDDGNYYPVYTDYEKVTIVNTFAQIEVDSINGITVGHNYSLSTNLTADTSTAHTVVVTVKDDKLNVLASKPVP